MSTLAKERREFVVAAGPFRTAKISLRRKQWGCKTYLENLYSSARKCIGKGTCSVERGVGGYR